MKKFFLAAGRIRRLVQPMGSCIGSDRITVDGCKVGFMYREEPDSDLDSGWRFFAGDETQDYADDPNNFALYDVNTIANYDLQIVPYLNAPFGSEFERDGEEFRLVTPDDSQPSN